jgi:unsaturated chondroitin disaccharide hydrolase
MRILRSIVVMSVLAGCNGDQRPVETLPRTIVARPELLRESRQLVKERNVYILPAYNALLRSADSALRAGPFSVMQKQTVPPSGDKHDYLSMAPYWWPDSTKPGGLPYVRRDGIMNPQTRIDHDGLRFGAMTNAVEALALAYWFTGEQKYAKRAALLVRAWFIDPTTRMNPNLRFAQAILGVTEGRGIGILDLRAFSHLVDAMRILETSSAWTSTDKAAFEQWCKEYLVWLRQSENGKDENRQPNNHGTLYDMQVAGIALFLGDSAVAREVLVNSAKARIDSQIVSDGSQPRELGRTRPIHYSLFNLDAFTQLAEMGRHLGIDLWRYRSAANGSIGSALSFIAPYAAGAKTWNKPDIAPLAPDAVSIALRRAGSALGNITFTNAAWNASARLRGLTREMLFYPGIPASSLASNDSLLSHALSFARNRLRATADSLDPAAGFPRATGADGRWEQKPYNQWTSGFFPGALWYMYQHEKSPEWKSIAERWTKGIEPARSITRTHDLGFMVFNSFGHGYLLTKDTTYRRVTVDAARSLATRYDPKVGAIRSWDTYGGNDARREWKFPVIVDNLMNLELLFRASAWSDPRWKEIAERHAVTSMRVHVRPDGSTTHVALFDPATGQLERTVTWQGYDDRSTWARGQAWAIYGFTSVYRFTGNKDFLNTAQRTADWFLAHVPPDGIPYWDFRHPNIPWVERDASAAAIAASGLLDLARNSKGDKATVYRQAALRMLKTLSSMYLTEGTAQSSILAHAVGGRPQNVEIDVGLIYADYYFVEALLRARGTYLE